MAYNQTKRDMLATKPVGKLLAQFAWPSIVSMCITSIYNLCDTIFIGQTVGALAIAGLAIAFPLMNLSTAFRLLSSVGGAAQTSLYMGRNDRQGAKLIYGNVIALSATIGCALMVLGLCMLDPILSLFGASDVTLPYAREYMQIYLIGLPIGHLFFSMTAQMRAVGNPREAMSTMAISVLINIVLDALFILVFDWGIQGAAWATVLAQTLGLLQCFFFFRQPQHYVHLTWSALCFKRRVLKRILAIGVSPFSVQLSGCLIVLVVNRTLMEQGGESGDLCVGAYGIMYRISQILILVVSGFAQGMQPVIGFNAGAGLYARVKEILLRSLTVATIVMIVGYTISFLWAEELASCMTDDADLIAICGPAMRIALCVFPLVGSQMIATTYFNSIGHARLSMITSLSRMWVFLFPLLLILPSYMGLHGVWWSMSIADCASVLLAWTLLWREIKHLPINTV